MIFTIARGISTFGLALSILLSAMVSASSAQASEKGMASFKTTVWPIVRSRCVNCHGDFQNPKFAVSDLAEAYANAQKVVDLADIEKSKMLYRSQNGHCGASCKEGPSKLRAALKTWASAEGKGSKHSDVKSTPGSKIGDSERVATIQAGGGRLVSSTLALGTGLPTGTDFKKIEFKMPGFPAFQVTAEVQVFGTDAYRFRSFTAVGTGRRVTIQGMRALFNGEFNRKFDYYSDVSVVIEKGQKDVALSMRELIIPMEKTGKDTIALQFGRLLADATDAGLADPANSNGIAGPKSASDPTRRIYALDKGFCALTGNSMAKCWGDLSQLEAISPRPDRSNTNIAKVDLGNTGVSLSILSNRPDPSPDGMATYALRSDRSVVEIKDGKRKVISFGAGRKVTQLSRGSDSVCGLLDDGSVKCFGKGDFGLGQENSNSVTAEQVATLKPIDLGGQKAIRITSGGFNTCAVLQDGTIRCWGVAQLDRAAFEQVVYQSGDYIAGYSGRAVGHRARSMGKNLPEIRFAAKAVDIAVGAANNACAVFEGGRVICWGTMKNLGQSESAFRACGVLDGSAKTLDCRKVPLSAPALRVRLGASNYGCAILVTGGLECWGDMITDGTTGRAAFVAHAVDVGPGKIEDIAVGLASACAIFDNNEVACWGRVDNGGQNFGLPISAPTIGEFATDMGANIKRLKL